MCTAFATLTAEAPEQGRPGTLPSRTRNRTLPRRLSGFGTSPQTEGGEFRHEDLDYYFTLHRIGGQWLKLASRKTSAEVRVCTDPGNTSPGEETGRLDLVGFGCAVFRVHAHYHNKEHAAANIQLAGNLQGA